jgi:hypothetical protein
VIAGQGMGLLSDVLVEAELASGSLVKAFDLKLPGYSFYLAHTPDHPRQRSTSARPDVPVTVGRWEGSNGSMRHRTKGSFKSKAPPGEAGPSWLNGWKTLYSTPDRVNSGESPEEKPRRRRVDGAFLSSECLGHLDRQWNHMPP